MMDIVERLQAENERLAKYAVSLSNEIDWLRAERDAWQANAANANLAYRAGLERAAEITLDCAKDGKGAWQTLDAIRDELSQPARAAEEK